MERRREWKGNPAKVEQAAVGEAQHGDNRQGISLKQFCNRFAPDFNRALHGEALSGRDGSGSKEELRLMMRVFLKAYETISIHLISRQSGSAPLGTLSLLLDENDINFIHQVRILYKKQNHPDESAPRHHRILAARYALLVAHQGLNPPLHRYNKKPVENKVGIWEVVNGVLGPEERLLGVVDTDEIADWWIAENKNAVHDTTSNGRKTTGKGKLPIPVVKITSFRGNKVSLAFRKVSKGPYARSGWYEVKDIHIDVEKLIEKARAAGFDRSQHSDGILRFSKWERLMEPEKVGKGGRERNPALGAPSPGWLGQPRPKLKGGFSGWFQPGPRTVDYCGLYGYSTDELNRLTHYKDVVCGQARKDASGEKGLLAFIREHYLGKVVLNINGIDIYLPDANIGFDYHEMLWHLESVVGRRCHWQKANDATKAGIRLIQVYEDEWRNKTGIVKSRIRCILGNATKMYAREAKVVRLDQNESAAFLERTHLQGNYNCAVAYGLEHDGRLVACMTFGVSRFNKKYAYELLRYSSELDTVVVGGAGKLLQRCFRESGGVGLVSYADMRWSSGNLYKQLGFKFDAITEPSYSYYNVCKEQLLSRIKITKDKLTGMFGFEEGLSVREIMLLNGFDRIWDAGQYRFSIPNP